MKKTIPAISIIIPMYNAEKYISECLDSIFAQTFQDFEVIVIDDCSTDKSCAIVENYLSTFNGGGVDKLKLIRRKVNSGSGAVPRNDGLRLSRGEYIFLMDNDDAITETALETLYTTAKEFNADVVHSDKCHHIDTKIFTEYKNQLHLKSKENSKPRDKPQLLTKDLSERIKQFSSFKIYWESWRHIIKRDLLMENNLKLYQLNIADDFLLTAMLICVAENFVIIQDNFYIWRKHPDSTSNQSSRSIDKLIQDKVGDLFKEIKFIDDFMNQTEFFAKNPQYKYVFFNLFATQENGIIFPKYAQFPIYYLDELIRKEIDKLGHSTALTAFLFNRMNIFNLQLNQQGAIIQQMNAHIQKQNQIIQQLQAQLKK